MTEPILQLGAVGVAPWIPLLPLLGAALIGVLGPRFLKGASHWLAVAGVGGALLLSILLFIGVSGRHGDHAFPILQPIYHWIMPATGIFFDVDFWIDPLTAIMLVTVCSVALLVVIYSRDYMRVTEHEAPEEHAGGHHGHEHGHAHDHAHGHGHHAVPVPERGYERYFAFICLFVFSMCTLVLSGNFLLLYFGWEAVGLCSYLLIGFYYQRPSAAAAAMKAFCVNRIGDFGFGLGILFIYLWLSPFAGEGVNPLSYGFVFDNIHRLSEGQITAIALLLFCGAVGKSAQLPLYVWLPDAMEGPSPVSALIHAATMVTAGVYMTVRCGAIFTLSPTAMYVVALVGGLTAAYAATVALTQYDMKRVLAYSTVSQLGYMFLGVGCYAAGSGVFHLFTHAFFKALLFLGAGSVMHAMGGIIDVRQFGGLRRIMPITFATFVIGSLALAGFPLLAGFFSKDEIIHAAMEVHPVLGVLALATALLTAFYTFRIVFLAFWGPERVPDGAHAHESGPWITGPLLLLSVGAVFAGYLGVHFAGGGFLGFIEPHGWFHHFLEPVTEPFSRALAGEAHGQAAEAGHGGGHLLMYVSSLLAIAGIGLAYYLYVVRPELSRRAQAAAPRAHTVLHNSYFADTFYGTFVVAPLYQLGRAFELIDRIVIDGIIWVVTAVPRAAGFVLRGLQNGAIQSYGVSMTAGMILLVLVVWWMR